MKLNALLMVLAGTAASAVAQVVPVDMPMETRYINLDGTSAPAFEDRASALVFQSYRNPFCAGGAFFATFGTNNSPKIFVEDFDFNPGPWGATTNNGLTEFSIPIQNFSTTTRTFVLSVRLFNEAVDYATPGQLIPAGAAVTGFNVNITQSANTFINWVIGLNAAAFVLPDNNGKIVVWLSTNGALANALPNTDTIRFVVAGRDGAAPALPGTSDVTSAFDFDDDNDVEITADPLTSEDYAETPAGGCGPMRPAFALKGDVLPTPPSFTQINPVPLNDGTTTVNAPAIVNGVKWYRFSLGGSGANDVANTYLDIDTEGSTATDTVIALYDANGNLMGNPDNNDGSGDLSQLSYGISRRAAVGDGRQYDGRDGELAPGDYFIGVAAAPASFSGAFIASGSGTSTDDIRVNVRSNAQGSPAGDAVAPTPTIDLGVLTTGTPTGQPVPAMQAGDTIWIKFQTCQPTDASNFVDIDFSRSNPITDPSGWLFDGEGNQLFASNDDGPSTLPQFSFGGSAPRPAYSGVAEDPSFGGEAGTLPAGTYYLAIAHEVVLTTGDRWHTRSENLITNIGLVADVYTSITDGSCGGAGCPWLADGCFADFNNDTGIDGDDVTAFFGAWDVNDLCADADGSTGVDGDDVTAFFGSWDVSGTGFPGC